MINPEDYEPDADDIDAMTFGQLAELPGPAHDVAQVLDRWKRERMPPGLMASHGVGTFLELLADAGYRVEPIVAPSFESVLPSPTE